MLDRDDVRSAFFSASQSNVMTNIILLLTSLTNKSNYEKKTNYDAPVYNGVGGSPRTDSNQR